MRDHCSSSEIVTIMNLDDELLGFNIFKVFNSVYQLEKSNVVYSNFLEYHADHEQLLKGYSTSYTK